MTISAGEIEEAVRLHVAFDKFTANNVNVEALAAAWGQVVSRHMPHIAPGGLRELVIDHYASSDSSLTVSALVEAYRARFVGANDLGMKPKSEESELLLEWLARREIKLSRWLAMSRAEQEEVVQRTKHLG